MKTITIIGAGAHGRVVAETATLCGLYKVLGFADDVAGKKGLAIDGLPVLGPWTENIADCFVVAIGNNPARKATFEAVRNTGRRIASIISPHASVSPKAHVGEGTVVLAGAVIQAGAKVGNNVIVNAGAIIDHDASIGDHAQVGLHATVASYGVVESGEFLKPGTVRLRS